MASSRSFGKVMVEERLIEREKHSNQSKPRCSALRGSDLHITYAPQVSECVQCAAIVSQCPADFIQVAPSPRA